MREKGLVVEESEASGGRSELETARRGSEVVGLLVLLLAATAWMVR